MRYPVTVAKIFSIAYVYRQGRQQRDPSTLIKISSVHDRSSARDTRRASGSGNAYLPGIRRRVFELVAIVSEGRAISIQLEGIA